MRIYFGLDTIQNSVVITTYTQKSCAVGLGDKIHHTRDIIDLDDDTAMRQLSDLLTILDANYVISCPMGDFAQYALLQKIYNEYSSNVKYPLCLINW